MGPSVWLMDWAHVMAGMTLPALALLALVALVYHLSRPDEEGG